MTVLLGEGEKNRNALQKLQAKFGQQQAKLRTMETLGPAQSGYGSSSQSWKKKTVPPKRTAPQPAAPVRQKTFEDPQMKLARKRAAEKLVHLIIAEDDTVLMLQEVTERLQGQRVLLSRQGRGGSSQASFSFSNHL